MLDLVSFVFLLFYHLGMNNDDINIFMISITSKVWVFDGICFPDQSGLHIMQECSCLGRITIVATW